MLERLLALRLIEEALEIRERRLLTRDRRLALRVEIVVRAIAMIVLVAIGALEISQVLFGK